jgi:hypothetical protein
MKNLRLYSFLLITTFACTQKNNVEKDTSLFLETFEQKLALSETEFLSLFKLSHEAVITQEGIVKTFEILQNKNTAEDSILCKIDFKNPTIEKQENEFKITLKANFTSLNPEADYEKSSTLSFVITYFQGNYFISDFSAHDLYNDYNLAIGEIKYAKERERAIATKQIFFEQAALLKKKFDLDSVVWYTQYNDSIYYYVVIGNWDIHMGHEKTFENYGHQMGMISETGRVVVPHRYDLVGTIGFEQADIIEVKKDGLVGLYSIEGKQLTEPIYQYIIPYTELNVDAIALVKKEEQHGWLDKNYQYFEGLPSNNANIYLKKYAFLNNKTTINKETTVITEVLHPEHIGYGIVIPTQHYVINKLFTEVIDDLYIGENTYGWGNTGDINRSVTFFDEFSESFSALFIYLNDTYVEGREEFYERGQITIVNKENTSVISEMVYGDEISFIRIDSNLVEMRVTNDFPEDTNNDYEGPREFWFAPHFKYFSIREGEIYTLKSGREYNFTAYVKIDSTYLEGSFSTYNAETQTYSKSNIPDLQTLKYMRNEILAEYGYAFKDIEVQQHFKERNSDYKPKHENYEDFLNEMSEIDKHNLFFLEKIVGTLDTKQSI